MAGSTTVKRRPTLSLNEWAVLGLLVERPRHGYDIAAELQPDARIGQVWRLTRPLVYRAIERLHALDLAQAERTEPGHAGPTRTVHTATRAGRQRLHDWLDRPVGHVRDIRAEFLLKLILAQRLGHDTARLVEAQRHRLDARVAELHPPPPPDEIVALWRYHSARAARDFLDLIAPT
jgi:DNA-binding PadR family transcriptional regulator